MIHCSKSKLIESYEQIGLQQKGMKSLHFLEVCSVESYHYPPTTANAMARACVLAFWPNKSYCDAIDLSKIKEDIMSMDGRNITPEILEEEEFMALSADLISDLIDEEPDTGKLPEVKVRFR